jgi:hypothetical protein
MVIEELVGPFIEMMQGVMEETQEAETITLDTLEQTVRNGLKVLGRQILQALVDARGTGKTEEEVLCPACGEVLSFIRYQGKGVETFLGCIRPERAYFHCGNCGESYVPLDHELNVGPDALSGPLEEAICHLATYMPVQEVSNQLARLVGVSVDDNTVQRASKRVGAALATHQKEEMEAAWQAAEPPAMEGEEPPERLYLSVDGTIVRLREGKREVKVAAIYETEEVTRSDGTKQVCAVDVTYVVSFEEAKTFARYVYIEAARRGLEQAEEVIVLGDGASWIWNHISDLCDEPLEILDFYHASRHVWTAGEALYGEDTPKSKAWVNERLVELLMGGPDAMLAGFWAASQDASGKARKVLAREIGYFQKHKEKMHYTQLRADGYHIGSGTVESACKRIIGGRLKQAGMIWSREGAEAMAHLRATVLNGRWDDKWAMYDRATRKIRSVA